MNITKNNIAKGARLKAKLIRDKWGFSTMTGTDQLLHDHRGKVIKQTQKELVERAVAYGRMYELEVVEDVAHLVHLLENSHGH
jgi:hypothetical protein